MNGQVNCNLTQPESPSGMLGGKAVGQPWVHAKAVHMVDHYVNQQPVEAPCDAGVARFLVRHEASQ